MANVIYASSNNPDMFYVNRIEISDPYFYVEIGNKKYAFLDYRDIDAFKEQNKNKDIEAILVNPIIEKATEITDITTASNRLAYQLFCDYGLKNEKVSVPKHFPLDMADYLRSKKIVLEVQTPFFPKREIKTNEEIEQIRKSLKCTHNAFHKIEEILTRSTIKGGYVFFEGMKLTSERLKSEVDTVLLKVDMINTIGPIISSDEQAACPHHQGHGPIKANVSIICDIFPINRTSGYFADMTRTYVKGKASQEMQRIYDSVKKSQELGISSVRPGIKATDVHAVCSESLLDDGFDVGNKGFIHGTGHGLGLEIHEPPFLNSKYDGILEIGHVITVEPGLYYKSRGSVRLEDVVVVTKNGSENLTSYPKKLVIP